MNGAEEKGRISRQTSGGQAAFCSQKDSVDLASGLSPRSAGKQSSGWGKKEEQKRKTGENERE